MSQQNLENPLQVLEQESLQQLVDKIKKLKTPECTKGDLHEHLNQVCVDVRCEDKLLEALCPGCIEDGNHSTNKTHQQRQLKRVMMELAIEANTGEMVSKNCDQVESKLKSSAEEFKVLGEVCLEISNYLEESIVELKNKQKEENIRKEKVIHLLQEFVEIKQEEEEFQQKLKEISELIKIQSDKILVNNDQFQKEWDTFTNEQKIKITAAQQLSNKVISTKVKNFLKDSVWKISKSDPNSIISNNNEEQVQQRSDSDETQKSTKGSFVMQSDVVRESIAQEPKPFGFSDFLRPNNIQITNGKIAKQTDHCFQEKRVALIEPSIPLDKKTFFAFQVISQNGWIGIGLALKDIVLKNNYGFSFESIDHGQYLISSNGYKWVHGNDEEQGTQICYTFGQYDILLGEFDPQLRRLRIKKKGSDRIAIIYVDKELMESQELMLCVNLSEKNDAIGLFVENDKSGEKKE